MSEITPERVAAYLAFGRDEGFVAELGRYVAFATNGPALKLELTLYGDRGAPPKRLYFAAVVVEGEEMPLVFDRTAFEQRVNERFDEAVRKLGDESLAFMPATIAALRAQILALDVDLAEAAQAEQNGGAAVAEQEPMRIAPTVFMVETEENVGATLVRMIDQDGREVYVGLDDHMRDLLVSMLVRSGGAANV